jgi:hypothetical protein
LFYRLSFPWSLYVNIFTHFGRVPFCGMHSRHISSIHFAAVQLIVTLNPNPTPPSHSIGLSHRMFPYPAMLPSLLVSGFLSFVESRPVKMGPTRPETSVSLRRSTAYCDLASKIPPHPLILLAIVASHVSLPRYAAKSPCQRLSFLRGISTREDRTDTLSRNVGK